MKVSIPTITSLTSRGMPTSKAVEKRKKVGLPKGGGSNIPSNPVPDVGKERGTNNPASVGPSSAAAAPSGVAKDIPNSISTDAAGVASDIGKEKPMSVPKSDSIPTGAAIATVSNGGKAIPTGAAIATVSNGGKAIPTSDLKPGPTATPVAAAPSKITMTVTSTTTVHHTDTTTVTGTGTCAASASTSTPSGPIHAGELLSGAALTDAILAQCPKITGTVTKTVSMTSIPVTSLVTQTAIGSASPVTNKMTSTVIPQADRAPGCSALPMHRKKIGPAEIMAVVFGCMTLALLVAMFLLARKCYKMHRAQRVWGKQMRNAENEMTEIGAGSGNGGAGVVANPMAVHPARAGLGQRVMDKLAKTFERKEPWEK